MKNIEEILHKMKELNPDIKMDKKFRKFLKNKLEVTAYSKIKNTQNKKINIAESGFFSLKKTNSNIFEKPKFNFLKLLSPIFIGAFVVFGFVNFYGDNFPIIPFHKGDRQVRSKIVEKQEIKNNTSINTEIIDLLGNDNVEEKRQVSENIFGMQDTSLSDLKEDYNFEDFCNSKNGKIENNICIYGEKKCSLEEFNNKKCD